MGASSKAAAAALIAAVAFSGAARADSNIKTLFATGVKHTPSGYACFTRVYDAAHLKAHPRQYVTKIRVLAALGGDKVEDHYVLLELDGAFRNLETPLMMEGSCGLTGGGPHCGITCEGGEIGVQLKGTGAMLLTLPVHPTMWPHNWYHDAANALGSDDRVFRLDRAPLSACRGLAIDDEGKAILGAAK